MARSVEPLVRDAQARGWILAPAPSPRYFRIDWTKPSEPTGPDYLALGRLLGTRKHKWTVREVLLRGIERRGGTPPTYNTVLPPARRRRAPTPS